MRESINSGLHFDLAKLEQEKNELEIESNKEDFWSDQKVALKVINRLNYLKDIIEKYTRITEETQSFLELLDFNDEEMIAEVDAGLPALISALKEFELQILFKGEFDSNNAILEIHPGAGGTEAQDWADMLYRMYVRFAEDQKFKMTLIDFEPGEEAGLKSVTIKFSGKYAYGLLKGEKGVHRLVRISPFDANKRRHTSFASVNVIPEFKDNDIDIQINETDLKIDTYRSGGAGGQNVNKVETAVRITHLPTGIVVSCQVERSQLFNKATCMQMLTDKLMQMKLEEREKELKSVVGEQKNIEWGSQIRSYVFQPYQMVKDLRTDYERGDISNVMDGDISGFLYAYLEMEARGNGAKN